MTATSLSFTDTLRFTNLETPLPLWKASETYLHFGTKIYEIVSINKKSIQIKRMSDKSNLLPVVLKAIFCFSIALPLTIAAGIVKAVYRRRYSWMIINKARKDRSTAAQNIPLSNTQDKHKAKTGKVENKAYPIDDVITRISTAKANGKHVGLFLGRTNDQPLPQEEGWEWFSLDSEIREGHNHDKHLKMNFNCAEDMKKIQHLFDKAVSDFSTIKFYDKPLATLREVLMQKGDSELIIEGDCGYHGINTNPAIKYTSYDVVKFTMITPISEELDVMRQENKAYQDWQEKVTTPVAEQRLQEYMAQHRHAYDRKAYSSWTEQSKVDSLTNDFKHFILKNECSPIAKPNHLPDLLNRIKRFAECLFFDEVTLHHGNFPYRTGNEEIETDYWIMLSPKHIDPNQID